MFSKRTKLSLCQFLLLQEGWFLRTLLEKHDMAVASYGSFVSPDDLQSTFMNADPASLQSLVGEIVRTGGDLRNRVSPRYRYDERWQDFELCLRMDGYRIADEQLTPVDPTVEGSIPIEDDLTRELNRSTLPAASDIVRMMNASGDDFRRVPPDYNGCLTHARVALESLGRSIARERQLSHHADLDESKWGQVLAYLRISGLILEDEEKAIAGVYGFVSAGAHRPIGLTEEEMARLGRSLVAAMCYFLVKRHNSS